MLKRKIPTLIMLLGTQQIAATKNHFQMHPQKSCATKDCAEKEGMMTGFNYNPTEQFADIRILRYQVPDFNKLSLKQKKFAYYLSQATFAGRDIFWDQNYRFNLTIRRTLEAIVLHYTGDRTNESFHKFLVYTKCVWFSNGIHDHYSNDKILPEFNVYYFQKLVQHTDHKANFPLKKGESKEQLVARLTSIFLMLR